MTYEKPKLRHPERSEGSPNQCSELCLLEILHCVQDDVIWSCVSTIIMKKSLLAQLRFANPVAADYLVGHAPLDKAQDPPLLM